MDYDGKQRIVFYTLLHLLNLSEAFSERQCEEPEVSEIA